MDSLGTGLPGGAVAEAGQDGGGDTLCRPHCSGKTRAAMPAGTLLTLRLMGWAIRNASVLDRRAANDLC